MMPLFRLHCNYVSNKACLSYLNNLLVPSLAGIMQTVLLDVLLYVRRTTQGATLRTAVRGLVCVDAIVSFEAALVGQQH